MKGKHWYPCIEAAPECLCNTCKHDREDECCAELRGLLCPACDGYMHDCPDYEPDDEEVMNNG